MDKNKIIARLILSTGRKKRVFSLFQVYEDLKSLMKMGYSKKQISTMLGISSGMLNKFFSIEKIAPELKTRIESREIDSVALVHNLGKFNIEDQVEIVRSLDDEKMTTQDVRVLSPLRKKYPEDDINVLIKKLIDSKDIKISVIRIPQNSLSRKIERFVSKIKNVVGEENFIEAITHSDYYDVKITKKGETLLRAHAKSKKLSLNNLINAFIES